MRELFCFLLALNFDCFLSGLALGVSGIRISMRASLLVAGCSAFCFGTTMALGEQLLAWLPVEFLHSLGLVLLLLLTLGWIVSFCGKKGGNGISGLWRRPEKLDSNADKTLSAMEAFLLSLALALDNISGGLAFGLLGEKPALWAGMAAAVTFALLAGANMLGRLLVRELKRG